MRIENIHVDGFGVWTDKNWGPLGPGLNVFYGPNETGKSTLMAFIRSMLFGFEKRGNPKRYDPVNGGSHGGWLDLGVGDTHLRLVRKPGRHVRGTVTLYAGNETSDEGALERLLGGTTKTLYHNVFAFGLDELERFHTLEDSEIATHISGAGLGIGASRWTSVQKDLEARQSSLFLARGQNSTINVAFKELESVRDDLERRNKIQAKLSELAAVDSFPEGGIERLDLLVKQRHSLTEERSVMEREAEANRFRRLQMRIDPEECSRRAQIIDSLRTLMPRVDAVRRVYTAGLDRRDAIAQEKRTLAGSLKNALAPSSLAFGLFILLIWIGVLGLGLAQYDYAGAVLSLVSVAAMIWYRARLKRATSLDAQVAECSERLDTCNIELRKTENEAREIELEIRKLTGQNEVHQADIDARVVELDRFLKLDEQARALDEAAVRARNDIAKITQQIEEVETNIRVLLAEASATNEKEFLEFAEIYKQRRRLIHELERIPVEVPESGLLFDIHADEEAAFQTAQAELTELERRLVEARHESGRVAERITMMEKSEERSRALSRQETILARIDEAADQWAVITLCRALLDETRKIYETKRQPEVLREASSFFKIMTESRYLRVIAPLDGGEIQVERADGVRISPQILSRGTAEQLYLSMRLALVREYANHVDPLPVVFDDIFVNFDPGRSRNTFNALRELCATHQVLLFTCHPHLVEQVEEVVPEANIFQLQ